MRTPPLVRVVALAPLALALLAPPAPAQATGTWVNTSSATASYDSAGNWQSGTIPTGAGATANLTADLTTDQTITLDSAITLGTLNIGDAGGTLFNYTLGSSSGPALLLTDLNHAADAGAVTIAAPLALDGEHDVSAGSSNPLTLSQVSGSGFLTKLGSGTLVLDDAGTFAGFVTISGGMLELGSANALVNAAIIGFEGGGLRYAAGNTTDFSDRLFSGQGTPIVVDTNGQDVTFASTLNDAGGFTKLGAGSLTIADESHPQSTMTLGGGTVVMTNSSRLTGGVLTFAGGTLKQHGAAALEDSTTRIVNSTAPISIDVGDRDLTLLQRIDASNTGGLTKVGNGTLTLSGGAQYSGPTFLGGGTLRIITASADRPGDINRLGGRISGPGKLVIDEDGSLWLSGGVHTYSGGTWLNAGLLRLAPSNTLGTGPITFGGGALRFDNFLEPSDTAAPTDISAQIVNSTGPIRVGTAGVVGASVATFASPLSASNTGGLYLTSGTLVLAADNHYSGPTIIDGTGAWPTLVLGAAGALGASESISFVGDNGILRFSAQNTSDVSGMIVGNAGIIGIDTNGQTVTFASPLPRPDRSFIVKYGAGTLVLTADHDADFGVHLWEGTVELGNGGTTGWLPGAYFESRGGTLAFNRSDDVTFGGTLYFPSGSGYPAGSLVKRGSGTVTIAGDTYLWPGTSVTVEAGTLNLTSLLQYGLGTPDIATTVTGGTLRLEGVGHFTIANLVTAINDGGTVEFASSDLFGYHTTVAGGEFTINAGGLLRNSGATFNRVSDLALNGGELRAGAGQSADWATYFLRGIVTVGGTEPSLITTTGEANSGIHIGDTSAGGTTTFAVADATGNAASDLVISAPLRDTRNSDGTAAVASGLIKTGAGTLTLSGTNTYTGATTVNAGMLVLDGSADLSAFTVNSGATLSGGGSLGALTLASGGTLSPGSSPGLLTVNGDLSLMGTTLMELAAAGDRGVDYDAIDVNGAIAFDGTLTVSFLDDFSPLTGASFNLFDWTGAATGAFATLDLPALGSGLAWNTDSLYSGGILSVSGSAIPEPSTYAAIFGAAALAFAAWRRRRTCAAK